MLAPATKAPVTLKGPLTVPLAAIRLVAERFVIVDEDDVNVLLMMLVPVRFVIVRDDPARVFVMRFVADRLVIVPEDAEIVLVMILVAERFVNVPEDDDTVESETVKTPDEFVTVPLGNLIILARAFTVPAWFWTMVVGSAWMRQGVNSRQPSRINLRIDVSFTSRSQE